MTLVFEPQVPQWHADLSGPGCESVHIGCWHARVPHAVREQQRCTALGQYVPW